MVPLWRLTTSGTKVVKMLFSPRLGILEIFTEILTRPDIYTDCIEFSFFVFLQILPCWFQVRNVNGRQFHWIVIISLSDFRCHGCSTVHTHQIPGSVKYLGCSARWIIRYFVWSRYLRMFTKVNFRLFINHSIIFVNRYRDIFFTILTNLFCIYIYLF